MVFAISDETMVVGGICGEGGCVVVDEGGGDGLLGGEFGI